MKEIDKIRFNSIYPRPPVPFRIVLYDASVMASITKAGQENLKKGLDSLRDCGIYSEAGAWKLRGS